MAEILCPICQRPNDAAAERCWYCQAELGQDESAAPPNNTDWLNELREDSVEPEASASENSTPETDQPEEVPDWLARIRNLEQQERVTNMQQQGQPPQSESSDIPDWLKDIKAGKTDEKKDEIAAPEPPGPPPFAEEPAAEQTPTPAAPSDSDDTQDWLNRLSAWQNPQDGDASQPTTAPAADSQMPVDQAHPADDTISDAEDEPTPADGTAEGVADLPQGWQKLDGDAQETNPSPAAPLRQAPAQGVSQEVVEDLSDTGQTENADTPAEQLRAAMSEAPTTAPEPRPFEETPFAPDDLPDWLASARPGSQPKGSSEPVSEEIDGQTLNGAIPSASLPPWLQALRPPTERVFTELGDNTFQVNPEKGLLAGIDGALQNPGLSGEFRKPVGYGSSLKVSEKQKANANLFAGLVDQILEDQQSPKSKSSANVQVFLRLLTALALIAVIFIGSGMLKDFTIAPVLYPPEVVSMIDAVNAIPEDQPVLLCADFEPAVAGELAWNSRILLEHLLRRNLNLVILSTTPAGSTILQDYLQDLIGRQSSDSLDARLINLGYLPGGSSGLQLLATNLHNALPLTHEFDNAWNSAMLEPVQSLQDFGAIIVFGDKAETSRTWIEQIRPNLAATPLLFVISAQAAPLLQPYYQSGQVNGYLAGLSGSMAYESLFGETSLATSHLASYQASLLFIALLILLGGLIQLARPRNTALKGKSSK